MRIIAHLISVVLLVPGIVVSIALVGLGHLAGQPTLLKVLDALLDVLIAFFPAALLLFALWIALALMGFSTRLRRAGAIGVGLVAAATTGYISWVSGAYAYASNAGIFVPGAIALIIAIWLASTDWADPARPLNAGRDRA